MSFLSCVNFSSVVSQASVLTMSSQNKIKKGQSKSAFCGHFMAD